MGQGESKRSGEHSHSQLGITAFLVSLFFALCTFWTFVVSLQAALSGNLFNPSEDDNAATAGAEVFFMISLVGLGAGGVMAVVALRQENKKKTLPSIALGLCVLILLAVFGPAIAEIVT